MLIRISYLSLVTLGIATLVAAAQYATNTAVAAPPVAAAPIIHQENQPVGETAQKIVVEAEMNTTPTASPTTSAQSQTNSPQASAFTAPTTPVSVSIPSIKLNAPVIPLGVNAKGEMDVPSGDTNDVGWYKHGTIPGKEGSAVLDAHVYAALKNLRYAKVGDSVYVKDAAGTTRHFVIRSSMVYELASVPRELLFNRTGGAYLHIITCAGTFVPALDTYDHRLIVYAELVND